MKLSPLKKKIIGILKSEKQVSEHDIQMAERLKDEQHLRFSDAVVKLNLMNEHEILSVMSDEFGIPFIRLSRFTMARALAGLLPERLARKHLALPLSCVGDCLTLVMADPLNTYALDDMRVITQKKLSVVLATSQEINQLLDDFYRGEKDAQVIDLSPGSEEVKEVRAVEGESLDTAEEARVSTTPIVRLVDLILIEAHRKRASDIHIEPFEDRVRVRYRVDGELIQALTIPKKNLNALVARIKILAALDITENRVPQDGRFKIRCVGAEIDYRVSVLPVYWGSKVVLRALEKSTLKIGLEKMGFSPGSLKDVREAIQHPFGMIIITGPTGSGKSTTLYAILNELNTVERNIITVEDPVEYQLEGITQIQARPEIGLSFASGLRAILRQSPDVVMLGEIRDVETADIAVKASLTGQIVLSTLHTNDAASAITRLEDMGVEPFLISASLVLLAAQRLVRRICPRCRGPVKVPGDLLEELQVQAADPQRFKRGNFCKGKGCGYCNETGYHGRVAIVETLPITHEIRKMVEERRSLQEIRKEAQKEGMITLRQDALDKCYEGITTLEEVLRVTSEES